MCVDVLLSLLIELRKIAKIRGLPSILSHFRNEFNQFNSSEACISHDINCNQKSLFWRENVNIVSSFAQRYNGRHYETLRNL